MLICIVAAYTVLLCCMFLQSYLCFSWGLLAELIMLTGWEKAALLL